MSFSGSSRSRRRFSTCWCHVPEYPAESNPITLRISKLRRSFHWVQANQGLSREGQTFTGISCSRVLISRVLVHSRNQLPEFKSKSNMENSCRLRVCSTSFSCEMGGIETIQSPLKREAGIMFFQDLFFCDVKRDIQLKPCFQHLHLHSVPFLFPF